jgi:hypothetical protein
LLYTPNDSASIKAPEAPVSFVLVPLAILMRDLDVVIGAPVVACAPRLAAIAMAVRGGHVSGPTAKSRSLWATRSRRNGLTWWWLGSKCRKWQTDRVSNCIDLGQLLHLEPTQPLKSAGLLLKGPTKRSMYICGPWQSLRLQS